MVEGEADEIYQVNKLLAIEDMDWVTPIISSSEYSFAKSKLTLPENSNPGDFLL